MAIGELCLSNGAVRKRSTGQDMFMGKGDRKDSYVRSNSQMQMISNSLFPIFLEAVDAMRLPNPQLGPMTVAEFGSSSGQSSIDNVGAVLRRLKSRYDLEIGPEPEYQVFFQDMPSTDFNSRIKLLNEAILSNEDTEAVDFFAAAVPGPLYGRLFPQSTLHFAFATFAINCLSRIPESVSDRSSPAYNGGQTGLYRSSAATMEAYSAQAKEDLLNFLAARAEEMSDEGVLCLNFRCRDSGISSPYSTAHEVIGDCIWDDFVDKGIISASTRDAFNPLHYWRTVQEVKEVLSNFSSEFHVEKQMQHQVHLPAGGHDVTPSDEAVPVSKSMLLVGRGVSSALLRAHFGREVTSLYLERYEQVLMDRIGNHTLSYYQPITWFVVVLVRKAREYDF
ncbi:hypothetical protein MPTK1_3g01310 [Marchantia polymorpha subsp. ruderalis]|uniref:Uncharacterized protein n=2 Tax=Marchantia polymorpha TaxID=3197 RepID=A0AAF6AW98_MARPO|nr:hypothetical protein MARPO_0007s0125 [Marchantia polymorpha]BBN04032.1 hypothetical protein Mp_3g01310 [Marchantia polymorpha subsp. ruderalis]|eukprot:PTQ47719.1 hypothetical protein MARPO_0007s0125 [Marchantia polymorpha]